LAAAVPAAWTVSGLTLAKALALHSGGDTRAQLVLVPEGSVWSFRLLAAGADGTWSAHAQGSIAADAAAMVDDGETLADLQRRLLAAALDGAVRQLEAQGLSVPEATGAWRELRLAEGEALVRIDAVDPGASLDAALLASLPALGDGMHVFTGAESVSLHCPIERTAWCHARRVASSATPQVDLRLFDAQGALLARVRGCRFAALAAAPPDWTRWLYVPHWSLAPLPAGTTVGAMADELASGAAAAAGPLTAALETLARQWLVCALADLGWTPAAGDTFAPEALAVTLGVHPPQRRLFLRLLQILQEDGVAEPKGPCWQLCAPLSGSRPEAETLLQALLVQHPHAAQELQLLGRCGRALAGVLRGTQTPVELLFPAGDPGQLTRLYQHGPSFAPLQALLGDALDRLLATWPAGTPLRVLEIGAGTGSSTAIALDRLPAQRCNYTFTDLSPHFLNGARERFGGRGGMQFRRLDIEQPPQAQGFQAGRYDLVIAANVLHATRDLRTSLDHARSLLAPGGVLLLLEGTAKRRWIDLTFGLLEGWWRFTDSALRPDYPLLDPARWRAILRETHDEVSLVSPAGSDASPLPQSIMLARRSALPATTLVFADARGVGDGLAARLRAAGKSVTIVRPSGGYRLDADEATLAPLEPDQYRRLLDALGQPPAAVVHLWSLDLQPGDESDGCTRALYLAQALVERAAAAGALWLVTQGAQDLPGGTSPLAPFQAPVWGLALAIAHEHPELGCRLVDLAPGAAEAAVNDLWCELQSSGEGGGWRSGWRGGERWQPGLGPFTPPTAPIARLRGCHLVTGGTGGIGRRVAASLAERGADTLVLASRHAAASADAPWLVEMRATGVTVHLLDCDVGDAGDIDSLLAWIAREAGPLHGVHHCAGAFSDAVVQKQERSRFQHAFRAKAMGAWHLHLATRGLPLEAFVLCSSAFSLLPAAGLASYAAANAFLDVLAAQRRREGLPALSINWGPWADVGMAAAVGPARARQWAASGLASLEPGAALEAMARLQGSGAAQVAVMDVDWNRLSSEAVPASDRPAAASVAAPLLDRLREAPPGQRGKLLLDHVTVRAAAVLGFPEPGHLDVRRSLFSLGMDSLTAMELRSRLQQDLQLPLPATLLLEHAAPAALARHLEALLFEETRGAATQAPVAPAMPAAAGSVASELAAIEQLLKEFK
jgi:microcystin synthetase protein McyG